MRECIGQAVRWSRNAVHQIDHIALNTARNAHMADQFNFNEDILCMNKEKFDKRNHCLDEHVGGEESSPTISAKRVHACIKFSISGVDGLEKDVPKRKYSTTKRVAKDKGKRRIGSSRVEKISLASVERDLKLSRCSKGCLQKLNVEAILMKRFKTWGSDEYEEKASWILENLTEYYNEEIDKFETKLCGLSVCNGCYAVALTQNTALRN